MSAASSWHGLHGQVQEVRRAADARVVAADELFDAQHGRVMRQVENAWRKGRQIRFDRGLVLTRRRDDLGMADEASVVELVCVEDQATWRLCRPSRASTGRPP